MLCVDCRNSSGRFVVLSLCCSRFSHVKCLLDRLQSCEMCGLSTYKCASCWADVRTEEWRKFVNSSLGEEKMAKEPASKKRKF